MHQIFRLGVLLLSAFTLVTAVAGPGSGYLPPAMVCKNPQDPNCVGSATVGLQIPLPTRSGLKKRQILGRCEMIVDGEVKPRTCEGLRLVVRSARENEPRQVYFTGFGFKVDELHPDQDYSIEASSDQYEIKADQQAVEADDKVKIRLRAKPRL